MKRISEILHSDTTKMNEFLFDLFKDTYMIPISIDIQDSRNCKIKVYSILDTVCKFLNPINVEEYCLKLSKKFELLHGFMIGHRFQFSYEVQFHSSCYIKSNVQEQPTLCAVFADLKKLTFEHRFDQSSGKLKSRYSLDDDSLIVYTKYDSSIGRLDLFTYTYTHFASAVFKGSVSACISQRNNSVFNHLCVGCHSEYDQSNPKHIVKFGEGFFNALNEYCPKILTMENVYKVNKNAYEDYNPITKGFIACIEYFSTLKRLNLIEPPFLKNKKTTFKLANAIKQSNIESIRLERLMSKPKDYDDYFLKLISQKALNKLYIAAPNISQSSLKEIINAQLLSLELCYFQVPITLNNNGEISLYYDDITHIKDAVINMQTKGIAKHIEIFFTNYEGCRREYKWERNDGKSLSFDEFYRDLVKSKDSDTNKLSNSAIEK